MTLCSHTITRNGGIFIEPCLRQILPYVDRALVLVDMRSEDGTIEVLKRLSEEYPKLELDYYNVGHEY
ncbi:MAG TPA: hypothetical protein ENI23_05205, partial [bacterium]|nr:hypothetical protein [bacterium]